MNRCKLPNGSRDDEHDRDVILLRCMDKMTKFGRDSNARQPIQEILFPSMINVTNLALCFKPRKSLSEIAEILLSSKCRFVRLGKS